MNTSGCSNINIFIFNALLVHETSLLTEQQYCDLDNHK